MCAQIITTTVQELISNTYPDIAHLHEKPMELLCETYHIGSALNIFFLFFLRSSIFFPNYRLRFKSSNLPTDIDVGGIATPRPIIRPWCAILTPKNDQSVAINDKLLMSCE